MSFFLRNFAGFLIQFGGGMLLSLFPFEKETFRYPRKQIIIGYSVLAFLFSAGFPFVMSLALLQNAAYRSMTANVYMLAAILLFTVLYFWIIRSEIIKKLLVLVLVLFYAATQYLLVNLVSPLFPGGILPDSYPPLILAFYAGTAAVLFPLTVLIMRRAVREYLAEMEIDNIRKEFGSILLASIFYFLMLVIYASRPDTFSTEYWWWILPPLLLAVAVFCIFYWTLFRESVRRKRDSEQRKALEIQKLQYETIIREMEQTRRMRHDMRHSFNRLSEMLNQGDEEGMRAYLSDLTLQINHRETVDYCKNTIVNGLLQYYVGLAADHDIRCKVQAQCGELTASSVDLTVLLGNAMENSIRACQSLEDDRWIDVQIDVIGGSLVMQIENPCSHVHPSGWHRLSEEFLPAAAFVFTHEDGHGYGLSSIEHTARKYGGSASFRYDEKKQIFTTRIWINGYT